MMMLREETKVLFAQWHRSLGRTPSSPAWQGVKAFSSGPRAKVAQAYRPQSNDHAQPQLNGPVSVQRRPHLNVVSSSQSQSEGHLFTPSSSSETNAKPAVVPTLVGCTPVNNGKQVVLNFSDETSFEVHSAWLKDSSPKARGADFYRTSAADVWQLGDFVVRSAELAQNGQSMVLTYESSGDSYPDEFETCWLHAFAPFVGKALHKKAEVALPSVKGTGSLLAQLHRERTPWTQDMEIPTFDADMLCTDVDTKVSFLEKMVDPGVVMIKGLGTPESLEREGAGAPLEKLAMRVVGKLNQHPVRSTNYGVMRKTSESASQGADYDMANPLSMHTDHSVYQGTPGYLQFLYQAEGSVRSKVCDGLALAEHVREHHPEAFKILTTVEMTHSSRNTLYTREGSPRSVYDSSTEPSPFELVHTHPIIQLDSEGQVEKVVQSETKRGVCALPYEVYDDFMEAYALWTRLCEDDRFIKHFDWPEGTCIVTNNYRTLHGRASVPPGMARTMVFGYVGKIIVENHYRLLKQIQKERSAQLDSRWLTRIPNQVLEQLLR